MSNNRQPKLTSPVPHRCAGIGATCLAVVLFFSASFFSTGAMAQIAQDTRVLISLELPHNQARGRYKEPFVAIWLESEDGQPRTSIRLLYDKARWLPDLELWWELVGQRATHRLDAVSGATQGPGNVVIEWNGLDSHQREIETGNWILAIEVVREEGERELVRLPIALGQGEFSARAAGSGAELGAVKVLVLSQP